MDSTSEVCTIEVNRRQFFRSLWVGSKHMVDTGCCVHSAGRLGLQGLWDVDRSWGRLSSNSVKPSPRSAFLAGGINMAKWGLVQALVGDYVGSRRQSIWDVWRSLYFINCQWRVRWLLRNSWHHRVEWIKASEKLWSLSPTPSEQGS